LINGFGGLGRIREGIMTRLWLARIVAALALLVAGPAFADGRGATKPLREAGSGAPPPIAGPAIPQGIGGTVAMPNGGSVTVPAGWRLYGAPDAKAYLGRIGKTAAPGDVMGMLAPEGAKITDKAFWGAVLTWSPIGYVAPTGGDQFAQPGFLDKVKTARGMAAPAPVSLPVQPAYEPVLTALTWAEQFNSASANDRNVRMEGRVLARDGFTGITIHCAPADVDARKADLAKIAAAIAFPAGRRHADFRKGDLDSGFDLPGLVTGSRPTKAVAETANVDGPQSIAQTAQRAVPSWFPWIGAALIGLPLILWLIYGRKPAEPDYVEAVVVTPRAASAAPMPPPSSAPGAAGPTMTPSGEEVRGPRPPGADPNLMPPRS
jgi:uncharacterized membrane-anchored protein